MSERQGLREFLLGYMKNLEVNREEVGEYGSGFHDGLEVALEEFDRRFLAVHTVVSHEDEPKAYLKWYEYLDPEE